MKDKGIVALVAAASLGIVLGAGFVVVLWYAIVGVAPVVP